MNAERRKELAKILVEIDQLGGMRDTIRDWIDTLKSEEEEYYENMPEAFQNGEKGEKAQAAMDALQNAYDCLDSLEISDIENYVNEAMEA